MECSLGDDTNDVGVVDMKSEDSAAMCLVSASSETSSSVGLAASSEEELSSTSAATPPPPLIAYIDPACDPANPRRIQFADISTAAFNIRDGIVRTPTVVGDCAFNWAKSANFLAKMGEFRKP